MGEERKYHPVDHGWSWAICLGTGVMAFFVGGCLKSMGVLFVDLVVRFDAEPSVAALTLGLQAGGFALFGMLANALGTIFGYRVILLFGGSLCSAGAFLAIFARNIYHVIVCLGLISGLAFGAMFSPSIVLLNHYFERRKSLANGLALMGSSVGQFSLPYLITFCLDHYGYQGAMLLYTGLCMQTIPAALIMRPMDFWLPNSKKPKSIWDKCKRTKRPTDAQENCDPRELAGEVDSLVVGGNVADYEMGRRCKSLDALPRHRAAPTVYYGSQQHIKTSRSTLAASTEAIVLGSQHLIPALTQDKSQADDGKRRHVPTFCQVLFDRDLMTSLSYWMLLAAFSISYAGYVSICLYMPALAFELFHDRYIGALLLAIIGGCDIISKVAGGAFADLGLVRRSTIAATVMLATGLVTILAMFYPVFPVMVTYSLIVGLITGAYRMLIPVLIKDLFGLAKLSSGMGICNLSMGLVILPMPTLLGYMQEVYGTYIPSMYLNGSLLVAGSVLMFLVPLWRRMDVTMGRYTGPTEDVPQDMEIDVTSSPGGTGNEGTENMDPVPKKMDPENRDSANRELENGDPENPES